MAEKQKLDDLIKPGTKSLTERDVKIRTAAEIIKRLNNQNPDDKNISGLINECENLIADALASKWFWLPWQAYFADDASYAFIHQIRHNFCKLLPIDQLTLVIEDIRAEHFYLPNEFEQNSLKTKLDTLVNHISGAAVIKGADKTSITDDQLRSKLYQLSIHVAHFREAVWLKVNLMRTRLMMMLFLLVLFLVICLFLIPPFFDVVRGGAGLLVFWYHIFGLQILGALGGLMSALFSRESLELPVPQFYLEQTRLYLRPAVGAAAGLIIGLLQLTGLVSILGTSGQEKQWPILLTVAFLAGFSERLFMGRIEKLVGKDGTKNPTGKDKNKSG